jgi:outer membrane protein assembly factor BamD (BamD/ComL family)
LTDQQTEIDDTKTTAMLYERGVDFFTRGDYLAARRDFKKMLTLKPSMQLEEKARLMLRKTGVDWIEWVAGVAVLALVVILFAVFGWR